MPSTPTPRRKVLQVLLQFLLRYHNPLSSNLIQERQEVIIIRPMTFPHFRVWLIRGMCLEHDCLVTCGTPKLMWVGLRNNFICLAKSSYGYKFFGNVRLMPFSVSS